MVVLTPGFSLSKQTANSPARPPSLPAAEENSSYGKNPRGRINSPERESFVFGFSSPPPSPQPVKVEKQN